MDKQIAHIQTVEYCSAIKRKQLKLKKKKEATTDTHKSQLIGKDPDAGKDWRQKEKGETEDEMVR